MSDDTRTLREHLEATKTLAGEFQKRHQENSRGNCTDGCGVWRCADRYAADELEDHAVAALDLLDNAEKGFLDEWGDHPCRLIPDPERGAP